MDWIPSHVTTLRMRTEMVLETLVCLLLNHSTWIITQENFTVILNELMEFISVHYLQVFMTSEH